MTIVFIGDIHLGRRPSGLGSALAAAGLDARRLSAVAGWKYAVQYAVDRGVRAVVLAGDVVDSEKDRFEAYTHLERGIADLTGAGVAVLGVAGNHDSLVLPRLIRRIPEFHLIGAGGTWECVPVPGEGHDVDLLGWSMPGPAFRDDPLADPTMEDALAARRAGATMLGVLHGDRGNRQSRYAPLDPYRLDRAKVDAWFLGHIHAPDDLTGDRPVGYLGSLVGLDVNEPGAHGPWNVHVEGGRLRVEHVPLAPVRWEYLDVPLDDGVDDADGVHEAIVSALQMRTAAPTFDDPRLLCVIARVRLTGKLTDRSAVHEFLKQYRLDSAVVDVNGRPCILESVQDATRPAVDLELLSRERTPAGRVARLVLALQAGEADDLVGRAGDLVARLTAGRWTLAVEEEPPNTRECLQEAGWRALDLLLEQRENRAAR